MYAIVKFREIEDAVKFDQVVASFAGWELKRPLNSKVEGCIRVLNIGKAKGDKALYEYLRDAGAFEEVTLE